MTIAKTLESKLYTRVFSYFPPMTKEEERNYLKFSCKFMLQDKLKESLDQLPVTAMDEETNNVQTPTKLTPSKLNLRRQNSAFKQHVSERIPNKIKPLTISKETPFNSTSLMPLPSSSHPHTTSPLLT